MSTLLSTANLVKVAQIEQLLDAAYAHHRARTGGAGYRLSEGHIWLDLETEADRDSGKATLHVGIFTSIFGDGRWEQEFRHIDQALAAVQEWHDREMATDHPTLSNNRAGDGNPDDDDDPEAIKVKARRAERQREADIADAIAANDRYFDEQDKDADRG